MSGVIVAHADRPSSREDCIRVAIARMDVARIRIMPGDLGVRRAGLAGGWELDQNRRRGPAVNLAGAVLLTFQPHASDDEPEECVAARAIGTAVCWLDALDDALQQTISAHWMASLQKGLYVAGWQFGLGVHDLLTSTCRCGARVWYHEPCTSCEEAAFVAREAAR